MYGDIFARVPPPPKLYPRPRTVSHLAPNPQEVWKKFHTTPKYKASHMEGIPFEILAPHPCRVQGAEPSALGAGWTGGAGHKWLERDPVRGFPSLHM